MRWLLTLMLAAALVGCGAVPSLTSFKTKVVQCPPKKPPVACPDWPDVEGTGLNDLGTAFIQGRRSHGKCRDAVEAWEQTWEACGL